jgi:predicted amidohydrolase YtcJ
LVLSSAEKVKTQRVDWTEMHDRTQGDAKHRHPHRQPGHPTPGRATYVGTPAPAAFPTRKDLDEVAPDRPVVLKRADGHALVANSVALKLSGIDRNTAEPAGGSIFKDGAAEPTGMLIDNAHAPPLR